jgi:hypothetical protein
LLSPANDCFRAINSRLHRLPVSLIGHTLADNGGFAKTTDVSIWRSDIVQ